MGDEDILGFPGGPPHPPYGDPLSARPRARDDTFAKLPDAPPSGSPPGGAKPKKRRSRKKKAKAEKAATETSRKQPRWRKTGLVLFILISVLFRLCGSDDDTPGSGSASSLLLGRPGEFAPIELEVCESGLVLELPSEKEMPSAGPPPDPRAVTGKGIGEVVWAIRMNGIIEPFGLRGRLQGENHQTVTSHHDEVALLHRVTGPATERGNHLIGLSFASGRVEWQELMLGAVLGTTAEHLWLAATASQRSTIIATVNMATGTIEDCFAAHSTSDADPPPLFDSYGDEAYVGAVGSPATSEQGLYVRPAGFEPTIQYLTSGADPVRLQIPADQSLWAMLGATDDIVAITPLESGSPAGSLQGWAALDLARVWGVSGIGERADAALVTPDTTVVHERARKTDESLTAAFDTMTGAQLWTTSHDVAYASSIAGLHVHEDTAVLSAFDLDTNEATTTFMGGPRTQTVERTFLDYARDDRIALITTQESGASFGRVFTLGPDPEAIAELQEVGAILTFNDERLIVEVTTQGEPWLLGIEFAPPSGGGGGGGKGGGGGGKDKEKNKGGNGGGGGGGTDGGDDEGPPST